MEKDICFYDIAERAYKNTNQTVELEDYQKECNKKFREILLVLELQEDYDGLKKICTKKKDTNGKEEYYMKKITLRFNEPDARFLQMLIEEYTGKLQNVRCGKFFEVDDEFAVELVEGFYFLFMTKTDEIQAKKIVKGICQKFEYPKRKLNIEIKEVQKILNQVIEKNNSKIWLSSEDEIYWMRYVREDLEKQLNGYLALYSRMVDIRCDEINDEAFREVEAMGEEQLIEIDEEQYHLSLINDKMANNEEVKMLKLEEQELLRKNTMKSWKRSIEIRERLREIYDQIEKSYGRKERIERQESSNRKSSKELVLLAVKELEEINFGKSR